MRVIGPQNFDGLVPTAAIADNAVTLAKMAGGTDGNLIGMNEYGNPAYIATGSDGHVLTSGGANVASAMEALPSSGGWIFLETQSFAGSTLDFQEGSVSAGYDYMFTWRSVKGSADNNIWFRIGTGGGPTYLTSGYLNGRVKVAGGSFLGQAGDTSAFDVTTSGGGASALETKWGHCIFHNPAAAIATECNYQCAFEDSGGAVGIVSGGGFQTGTAAITGFQILADTGTLDSGEAYLFRRILT